MVIDMPASDEDLAAVRELFREYVSAPGWEASFATYLSQQGFEDELANLHGVYAPPAARLLLARVDGTPAGCIAFKALEPPDICEMKRLYVRPEFRALGVGRQLVEAIIHDAAASGYRRMRLDTLPSMRSAQRLYHAVGFREIPAYCVNPVAGAIFMQYDLASRRAVTPGLFWRALVAFLALPGIVAFLVPWILVRSEARFDVKALPIVVAGTGLLLWCVRDFYVAGRGTLAPWAPPEHLVTGGLYRVSRNPMYLAVLIILAGLAVGFASFTLWVYAACVSIAFHVRVVAHEEPWLARTFGPDWLAYRARVRRWFGVRSTRKGRRHHLAVLFVIASTVAGCMPAERINRSCEWTGDVGGADRAHLIEDVRVAQDLSIRYGDSVAGRIWNATNRSGRTRCTEASFEEIMRRHHVSRAELDGLVGARDLWLDFLTVMLPMALLFTAVSRLVIRNVASGYDADDRAILVGVLAVFTPIAAAIGVGLAQIWGIVVEEARLRSDHISYRAANTPMHEHKWLALAVGVAIFLGLATVEVRRRSRE